MKDYACHEEYLEYENNRKQKVIDRLSRKIQRLNQKLKKEMSKYYINGYEVILISDQKFNALFGDQVLMAKVDKRFFNPGGEF